MADKVSKNREYDYFEEHTSEYARKYWNKYIKGISSTDISHPAGTEGLNPKEGTGPERVVRGEKPTAGGTSPVIGWGRSDDQTDCQSGEDDGEDHSTDGRTGKAERGNRSTDPEGSASEV